MLVERSLEPCALEANDLTLTYGGAWRARRVHALRGVDLRVTAGMVLGLVGPNGSGKTSAIRCALGLVRPTRGTVRIFGARAGTRGARRDVGYAPERLLLSGKRSGLATLLLLARLSGLDQRAARAAAGAALERVGIEHAAERRIQGYSKGMLRRLSVAAAIQHEPRLLVLDEPFDGLDPLGCALVRDEIARHAARGAAILVSSHALAELESVATHLTIVRDGEVLEHGARDQVLSKHGVTLFEAEGLDAGACAEVAATIARLGGRVRRAGPAHESLEELFRRRMRDDVPPPTASRAPPGDAQ